MLRTFASRWNKEKFRCYEAQIEESEKAGSRRESNPGHLACAASALPLRSVGTGGCPVVVAQWQSIGCTSLCPGFDSRQLPAFSLSSICAS